MWRPGVVTEIVTVVVLVLLCVVVAACDDCPSQLDDCIEPHITLAAGIYGKVYEPRDVIGDRTCESYAVPHAYAVWLQSTDGTHAADDTADSQGAFELAAAPGSYMLCVRDSNANERCGDLVTVPANGRARIDISTGPLYTTVVPRSPATCD